MKISYFNLQIYTQETSNTDVPYKQRDINKRTSETKYK